MAQNSGKENLLQGEQVIADYTKLQVNNQPGFSATVTNYRLLFWRTGVIHDIRLDAIAALSWSVAPRPLGQLIVGGALVLGGLVAILYGGFLIGVLMLVGGFLIIAWPYRREEKLEVYTAGAKSFSVSAVGPKETLFELYRAIRQGGG